jgi:LPS-assembly protein
MQSLFAYKCKVLANVVNFLSVAFFALLFIDQSFAQTLTDKLSKRAEGEKNSRMVVDAREIVFDNNKDRVSAVGNAQIYYGGRIIEADRVTYDKQTKRVQAIGNASITEADGTKFYGDKFDLTDDFRDGFVDSFRAETPDHQRFFAARAERTDGETTVMERGVYTYRKGGDNGAPEKPALWRVKAARIISQNEEQMVYYEDATLEFLGIPIAWVPYFSAPDPSVSRKSGWLAPNIINNTRLGVGAGISYFWAIAPNYDLTFSPTLLSRQGALGQIEWRHRLVNGSYNIKLAGISQLNKSAFLAFPYGNSTRDFRGSIESKGAFIINDKWKWGWDATAQTDKYFQQNYKIKTASTSIVDSFFKDSVSQIYLTGKGERSWLDVRGYYFQGLSSSSWQKTTPVALPVIDYDRRFETAIGGELAVNANFTNLNRNTAAYQETRGHILDPSFVFKNFGIYDDCAFRSPARSITGRSCLLRGIGGNYSHATINTTWRRQFIDPIGQVWTPFAGLRADTAFYHLNGGAGAGTSLGFNADQSNFLGINNKPIARVMPTLGLEYRYPFFMASSWGTQTIEPIAQLIARTNERSARRLPNEDAQSLVFDDTNIFETNKFSGYDRTEGGIRANLGGQYTVTANNGASGNVLFGQSYHIAGRNSFKIADVANTGLDSGLQRKQSDFIGRVAIKPSSASNFIVRGRFDESTFALKRAEIQANHTIGALTNSITYQRIASQPDLGFNWRREGILSNSTLRLGDGWQVSGGVLVDMSSYLYNMDYASAYNTPLNLAGPPPRVAIVPNTNRFRPAAISLGLGYYDEGTAFSITYVRNNNDLASSSTKTSSDTVLVKLEFKHLGEVKYNFSNSSTTPTELASGR